MPGEVTLVMPKPNSKQDIALRDRHRYVGYGGARGGGKSWFVRWKAILLCLRYPGIKILITRRTYKELLNNHINPLRQMLGVGTDKAAARYNTSEKVFTFDNGSTIAFGYCACDGDLGQYQGAEFDVWFADEAGQFLESWLIQIDACVRGVNDFPKRTYFTLNPGGPSHGYFKRLFVDRRFEGDEHPEDYSFIQALCTDNIALMESQPEYMRSLEKLPQKIKEAWLYGRWDVYEGQFFEDFRTEPDSTKCLENGITPAQAAERGLWTHVIEPFDLSAGSKAGWKIYRSFDWGYHRPFSCAWWAVDYQGTIYRIMELYGCTGEPNEGVRWTPQQVFAKIHEIESTHPWLAGKSIMGIADPAIWDAESGESMAETAARYRVYFDPGDNKRIPGWMQCHYRLQFDEHGRARMYVFSNCKAFIRTVPMLMYSSTHVEDVDTDMEDHVADEWRYMCMSRPIKPMQPVEKKNILFDPLDQFTNERR